MAKAPKAYPGLPFPEVPVDAIGRASCHGR